jgi:AraC-like DNA-binding protein
VLGVRLRPAGAWALLAHPLCHLAELTADLGDLLGSAGDELAEPCHDAGEGIDRVRRAVAWLGEQLRRPDARRADPAVHWVASRIADTGGRRPIAALRAETGLSDARLISLFRQQVGVTPKRLARIHRFDRALTMITLQGGTLADVAHRAGYFDQPHMNGEFREMAGLTPREFLAATRYPNSLSLPEPP